MHQHYGKIIGRIRSRQARASNKLGWGASLWSMSDRAIEEQRKNIVMRRMLYTINGGFSELPLPGAT